jgi:Spy/CpxP family protein refolding chaperone
MQDNRKWLGVLLIVLAVAFALGGVAGNHHMKMHWAGPIGGSYSGWGMDAAMMNPRAMHGRALDRGMMRDDFVFGIGPDGMMGGPDMMAWSSAARVLDLSDQQRNQIAKIQHEVRERQWDLLGKLRDERFQLHKILRSVGAEPAAVGEQYAKVADLQRQLLELSVGSRNSVDALLSQEQRVQLGNWWQTSMFGRGSC